jgi:hypothetical protein
MVGSWELTPYIERKKAERASKGDVAKNPLLKKEVGVPSQRHERR